MTVDVASDLNARVDGLLAEAKRIRERLVEIEASLRDCVSAARLYGVDLRNAVFPVNLRDALTIREIVLVKLREAGDKGLRVRDLRPHCGDVHEKTIGMSLYRLKKQGLCASVRHTWFASATKSIKPKELK